MPIRTPNPGELSCAPTAENGEVKFVWEDDGKITGYIAISRPSMPPGIEPQVWIHDVECWSKDPTAFLHLCMKARQQCRDWGFTEVRTNVIKDSPLLDVWLSKGFEIDQFLLKGSI